MLFSAAVAGMGAVAVFHQPYQFYDGEGNTLPYQAVDSLVRSQFVRVSPAATDTIAKYFECFFESNKPNVLVDLPEEYRLIKPTDTLTGEWQGKVLCIKFNNPKNQ